MQIRVARWFLVVAWFALGLLALSPPGEAADLPPHFPLRILIVSDEVNPHGLSDAELSQPGDLSAAISDPGSGLNVDTAIDGVVEIGTDDLADATALLQVPIDSSDAYDVVVYFSHRIPSGGSGSSDQEAFAVALENFLIAGGGLVSFHHGVYQTPGEESVQAIIGGTAVGSVPWNTIAGQNVINVAPGHFVTTNAVEYPSATTYADAARGVPSNTYGFFNNTPDERYLTLDINGTAGVITVLFASDYDQSGTTHLLGFEHTRPAWAGRVIAYQPGEYQPNALDDLDGNNFQILANAIHYTAYSPPASVPMLGPWARFGLIAALMLAGLARRRR